MRTIRKRGRVYHCRGNVRLGKETRYVEEHSTGCDRRDDAEAYRAKLEHQIRQEMLEGDQGRSRSLTVADAFLLYLNRPGGLHRNDVWRLGQLNQVLGDVPLASLADGFAQFKATRCGGLKPSTVNRFRDTAQAAANYAGREYAFTAPQIPRLSVDNQRVRFLTIPERDRLLAAYAPHVQPIALTLCFQGCRTQEALQLQWRHVDMESETLFFDRTKNGHPRKVSIHPKVKTALEGLRVATEWSYEGHVFLNSRGRPYADTRDYRLSGGNPLRTPHATACRRVGITDFRVHDWRHHWASSCVMLGIDQETIKRMGGWRSLESLERYAAVSTEHMATAIRKIA